VFDFKWIFCSCHGGCGTVFMQFLCAMKIIYHALRKLLAKVWVPKPTYIAIFSFFISLTGRCSCNCRQPEMCSLCPLHWYCRWLCILLCSRAPILPFKKEKNQWAAILAFSFARWPLSKNRVKGFVVPVPIRIMHRDTRDWAHSVNVAGVQILGCPITRFFGDK